MVKHVKENRLSNKQHNVKVNPFRGSTTANMQDHIKQYLEEKPDIFGIHSGTNDIPRNINTLKHMKKLVKAIRENSENTEIFISSIINRYDEEEYNIKIDTINEKIEKYCKDNNIHFVNNNNINRQGIGRDKIHLNYSGNSILAKNFLNLFNSLK